MVTERRELQGERLSRLSSPKRQLQTRVRPQQRAMTPAPHQRRCRRRIPDEGRARSIVSSGFVKTAAISWNPSDEFRGSERTVPRMDSGTTPEADKDRGPPPEPELNAIGALLTLRLEVQRGVAGPARSGQDISRAVRSAPNSSRPFGDPRFDTMERGQRVEGARHAQQRSPISTWRCARRVRCDLTTWV